MDPSVLQDCQRGMKLLQRSPGVGGMAIGLPDLDGKAWRHGRDWLLRNRPGETAADEGPDVYLASVIYANGGHTALIGDFCQALGSDQAWLILTNQEAASNVNDWEKAVVRTRLPEERIIRLAEGALELKMAALFDQLLKLKPRRLFLFHHPDDPLAVAAAQPEIAATRLMVHHADAMPSFGLHAPGLRLVDLNPFAAAMSRLQKLAPALLLLTSPDPGPRPGEFLRRGRLVTATCGSGGKFEGGSAYRYSETVGVILRATGGWHHHFGPLGKAQLSAIFSDLQRLGIGEDRFLHCPWVPDLAKALWECECDLYFASFPIDGARAIAEVIAASIPHIRHTKAGNVARQSGHFGGLAWHTWEDLDASLRSLANNDSLEALSRKSREYYDRWHHPEVFCRSLLDILSGGQGIADPDHAIQEQRAAELAIRVIPSLATFPAQTLDRLHRLTERIDFLNEKRQKQHEKIQALQATVKAQQRKARRGFWGRIWGRGKDSDH